MIVKIKKKKKELKEVVMYVQILPIQDLIRE